MPQRIITTASLLVAASILMSPECAADERDKLKVGLQPDGRIVVPTNQILQPAGTQVTFPGRPVDLLLIEGGRLLVAKNMRDLVFIDPATGAIKQTLALPAAAKGLAGAFSAVGLVAAGDRVFATDSQSAVRIAKRKADGQLRLGRAPRPEGPGRRRRRVPDRDRPPGRLAGSGSAPPAATNCNC